MMLPVAHGLVLAHDETAAAGPVVSWWLVAAVVASCAGYQWLVLRRRRRSGRAWSPWHTASWAVGGVLVAVALSPGLATHADGASHHMLQHVLLGMFAPLALVLAAPVTLALGALEAPAGRRVVAVLRSRPVHLLSHPVAAGTLHTGGLLALYLTPLLALSEQHAILHHAVHVHFLVAGCLFAWSVAGLDPAPGRPGMATRLAVLLAAAAVHAFLAKLLYARAGELPPGAGYGVAEVEAAAQLMYYAGDVAEVVLAIAVFAAWYRAGGHRRTARTRVRWNSGDWVPEPGRAPAGPGAPR